MDEDWSKEILEENLIYAIQQFNKYAKIYPIERNRFVVTTLSKLINEANKMQLEETCLDAP
jgi:hypothetical protein